MEAAEIAVFAHFRGKRIFHSVMWLFNPLRCLRVKPSQHESQPVISVEIYDIRWVTLEQKSLLGSNVYAVGVWYGQKLKIWKK
jgi:hypothetical protein